LAKATDAVPNTIVAAKARVVIIRFISSLFRSRSAVFADREDLVRDKAVGLAMDRVGVFGIVGFNKAEDLSGRFVDPVPEVTHPILLLGLQILLMGAGNIHGGNPAFDAVDIHEQ
jgi:hypothetical protein